MQNFEVWHPCVCEIHAANEMVQTSVLNIQLHVQLSRACEALESPPQPVCPPLFKPPLSCPRKGVKDLHNYSIQILRASEQLLEWGSKY